MDGIRQRKEVYGENEGEKKKNRSVAWYACEASLGKGRYVRLNEWKTRRSVCLICITNSLFPLDKSIHYCMIVKDNRKGQVTRRNKQTNEYFLH